MKHLEFQSNKESIITSLIGVVLMLSFVTLIVFGIQCISYDDVSGKLSAVITTNEEKALVVEDLYYTLAIKENYDIDLFSKYIGQTLNFYVNTNYGKNSQILSVDLIEAKYNGCPIPFENPYHYYKWLTFYMIASIIFVIYIILWCCVKVKTSKRMERVYSERSNSFSLINRRLNSRKRMYEDGKTTYDRKTYCTFERMVDDYFIEYTFVYFDQDTIAGLLKVHYQVCFFLETLKIKSKKTGRYVLDMSDKYKDRILDLSDKYKENELDSNLFHPEDVLPFANQILDEIDEQIRLRLPDIKI